ETSFIHCPGMMARSALSIVAIFSKIGKNGQHFVINMVTILNHLPPRSSLGILPASLPVLKKISTELYSPHFRMGITHSMTLRCSFGAAVESLKTGMG